MAQKINYPQIYTRKIMSLRTSNVVVTFLLLCTSGLCNADVTTKERSYVIATVANLRAQPSHDSTILSGLPIATPVEVHDYANYHGVGTEKDYAFWSKVFVLNGRDKGKIGWIASEYLVSWAPTVERILDSFDSSAECVTDIECKAAAKSRRDWAERAIALAPRNKKVRQHVSLVVPLPLVEAIRNGDLEQVKRLVQSGEDLNEDVTGSPAPEGNSGVTPLLAALFQDKIEIAKYLIEQGANPNAMAALGMGEDRYTPMSISVSKGSEEIVDLLIAKGANLNTCVSSAGGDNGTPLIIAIYKQHHSIAKLLIEKGADVNASGCAYGGYASPALCVAVAYPKMVKLLIARKADVNKKGEDGASPLVCAIRAHQDESIQLLLKAGADPNQADLHQKY